jgi:hypothetical protein
MPRRNSNVPGRHRVTDDMSVGYAFAQGKLVIGQGVSQGKTPKQLGAHGVCISRPCRLPSNASNWMDSRVAAISLIGGVDMSFQSGFARYA